MGLYCTVSESVHPPEMVTCAIENVRSKRGMTRCADPQILHTYLAAGWLREEPNVSRHANDLNLHSGPAER
jgi:hypothetical protein